MKSQYQDAITFIQDTKADFYYLTDPKNNNLVVDALLKALEVVSIQVECSCHGDSEKTQRIFIMSQSELELIKALIKNLNKY